MIYKTVYELSNEEREKIKKVLRDNAREYLNSYCKTEILFLG